MIAISLEVGLKKRGMENHSNCLLTSIITSEEGALVFFQKVQDLAEISPLRISVCQLSSPFSEWATIANQRLWLIGKSAHLLLPTDPIFHTIGEKAPSEFLQKDLDKLTKYFNSTAYEMYCFWMAEGIEATLERFRLESVELYTLEALLKDFVHEVQLSLIRQVETNFQHNIRVEGASAEIVKEIFRTQAEALKRLEFQKNTLTEMVRVIEAVEQVHPDLIPLKRQAIVLKELLGDGSWGRTFFLVQILNRLLNVVSAINGNDGARLGFAIQLALDHVEKEWGMDRLIEVVLNWDSNPNTQLTDRIWEEIQGLATTTHVELLAGKEVNRVILQLLPSAKTTEGKQLLNRLVASAF